MSQPLLVGQGCIGPPNSSCSFEAVILGVGPHVSLRFRKPLTQVRIGEIRRAHSTMTNDPHDVLCPFESCSLAKLDHGKMPSSLDTANDERERSPALLPHCRLRRRAASVRWPSNTRLESWLGFGRPQPIVDLTWRSPSKRLTRAVILIWTPIVLIGFPLPDFVAQATVLRYWLIAGP